MDELITYYAEVTVGLTFKAPADANRDHLLEKAANEAGGTEIIEVGDVAPLGSQST